MKPNQGDTVILVVPENPRLHRQLATVQVLEEWGAHTLCDAAGSGRFRALWEEMELPDVNGHIREESIQQLPSAREEGLTGNFCDICGSSRMKRNGSCELCLECGSTSGCS